MPRRAAPCPLMLLTSSLFGCFGYEASNPTPNALVCPPEPHHASHPVPKALGGAEVHPRDPSAT
jgi:hypothetical protein